MDEVSPEDRLAHINEQLRIATQIINQRENTLWRQGRKVEYLLIVCSLWAAYALLTTPSNFTYRDTPLLHVLQHYETEIGCFVLLAGCCKITAVVLFYCGAYSLCNAFRLTGLAMSAIFWVTLGAITMVLRWAPLFPLPGIMVGLIAAIMFHRLIGTEWWREPYRPGRAG